MALTKKRDKMLVRRGSDCQTAITELTALTDVYEDITHLGTGRFSNVALVTHKESGHRVALKTFLKDEVRYKDFIREYNYSYFLSPCHNIVSTFEGLYATKEMYFFAQEFCPTASLREAVYETGGLTEEQTKKMVKSVITGLEFMHGEGLVHRNMRAKNILIFDRSNYEKVKITDLALTRRKGTQVKHIDNPNEYHAPELCEILVKEQTTADPSLDVWALGVIIYFSLIAKYPWQKASLEMKPYFEWEQWMKKKTTVMPPKWGRFTEKGLKVFRKTLKPRPDDRCNVKDLKKYLGSDKWLKVEMSKAQSLRVTSSSRLKLRVQRQTSRASPRTSPSPKTERTPPSATSNLSAAKFF